MIDQVVREQNDLHRSVHPQRFVPIPPRDPRLVRRLGPRRAATARGITKKTHKHRRTRKQYKRKSHKKPHKLIDPLDNILIKLRKKLKSTRKRNKK